jgi:DNA-binding response OmpR family regulator
MRILIVEDEPAIAKNIAEYLRQQTFAVDIAYDGNKGWEFAKNNTYDVCLLDWMLPGMTGLELCQKLRGINPQAAIIMLTARDTLDDRVTGLGTGADDYLVKPFELRELLARIQALLRRSSRTEVDGQILRVGDLSLNTDTKHVERAGKEIHLTRKLYQLLEFLMRNAGKVVSKSDIEAHVWDAHAELWSDVVRSHIQKLRKELDDGSSIQIIRTVHGMGYTIDPSQHA